MKFILQHQTRGLFGCSHTGPRSCETPQKVRIFIFSANGRAPPFPLNWLIGTNDETTGCIFLGFCYAIWPNNGMHTTISFLAVNAVDFTKTASDIAIELPIAHEVCQAMTLIAPLPTQNI